MSALTLPTVDQTR